MGPLFLYMGGCLRAWGGRDRDRRGGQGEPRNGADLGDPAASSALGGAGDRLLSWEAESVVAPLVNFTPTLAGSNSSIKG